MLTGFLWSLSFYFKKLLAKHHWYVYNRSIIIHLYNFIVISLNNRDDKFNIHNYKRRPHYFHLHLSYSKNWISIVHLLVCCWILDDHELLFECCGSKQKSLWLIFELSLEMAIKLEKGKILSNKISDSGVPQGSVLAF